MSSEAHRTLSLLASLGGANDLRWANAF